MRFRISILVAALSLVSASHATVVPLPGSTPQLSVGTAPVRVQVLNEHKEPVPGISLVFLVPTGLHTSGLISCDPVERQLLPCRQSTDANGIADLGVFSVFSGTLASVRVMNVSADRYGSTDIVFGGNGNEPIRLDVVSGDHQVATIASTLPLPVVLRATRPDGTPVSNQIISTNVTVPAVRTDGNGYATVPSLPTGWALRDRAFQFTTYDAAAPATVTASAEYTVLNLDGSDQLHVQNLWWGGPPEDGWGMSVTQHGDSLFTILYVYDSNGDPIWFPSLATIRDTPKPSSLLYITRSTPFWSTDARPLSVYTLGGLALDFQGDNQATMTAFTEPNITGAPPPAPPTTPIPLDNGFSRKVVEPMDLTGSVAAPITGVADLWWSGPDEAGWGIALIEQYGSLVALWFTYDDTGRPTWFIMPGGEWQNASTYSGAIYRTSGVQWFNTTFRRDAVRVQQVGQFTLHFDDVAHATFEYSVQGHTGKHAIVRQAF